MNKLAVGWIGTGVMGKAMAGHLMKRGRITNMMVYNRTAAKADDLVQAGAEFLTPVEIAQKADFVFTMLGYPHDVENMILEKEGILKHMKKGSVLVDHTTSSPALARKIGETASELGVHAVDAPVSGGDIGAKNGELVIMIGGDDEGVKKALPLLGCFSSKCEHLGEAGAGQHTKAANQIMISSTMLGTCEALIYGHKAGLELDKLIELLGGGGAGSFTLTKLGPRMLRRDFDPGFYVEHFVKDLGIALEEGRKMGVSLPSTALANEFYVAMIAQGDGRMGTQGLLTVLERFNNTTVKTYP
mmetsp:Transcript_16632/g.19938  ORF Transcript_16632/g.19938 Transcript_16632/m.19938 type:complete len:301 (-) Transcript_16632:1909-2811(-)